MIDEDALESEYLTTSLRRAALLRTPNGADEANKEYDKLRVLLKGRLRLLPDKGEAILKRIASVDEPDVQIDAAACLLVLDEPFAVAKLERLANGRGFSATTAWMTLKEWRKGGLREYLG